MTSHLADTVALLSMLVALGVGLTKILLGTPWYCKTVDGYRNMKSRRG